VQHFFPSRRTFVKTSILAGASLALGSAWATRAGSKSAPGPAGPVPLRWLADATPAQASGVTWGVPWPRGRHPRNASFTLRNQQGEALALESWPLAFWPDGSLKWTAHAAYLDPARTPGLALHAGKAATPPPGIRVTESAAAVTIDTGEIQCQLSKQEEGFLTISRGGRALVTNGRLVLLTQDRADTDGEGVVHTQEFAGHITRLTVEQAGPVRAVVLPF
jgi:hypothetical protein